MAVIKCKMCGGDMELTADKTFGTCEYCGSTMTLPKIDDDQRAASFNRGNHFRRIGEFDKALMVYERMVREDDSDAEAHWCCALCRFGIEYVEDPSTYEYIPTCHRVSFDSFLEDVDYLAAVAHSDGLTKRQYQRDAVKIAEVQRGILATSQNEEPYDVFVCYKETDETGGRTRDSVMGQEIYYQLTENGHRVFFAKISLEALAGKQYEPYIFAALNSAKVMIVVGTKPEHLNAVWVKNEWSRFLAMMRKDRSKLLIPCYRDMDPYDMPEQLSVLQSYDMAKLGFMQDLTRGVQKVLSQGDKKHPDVQEVREQVIVQQAGSNMNALLKRGNMALEDGEWKRADEFFEEVLNQDAECAEAYLGKALAKWKYINLNELVQQLLSIYEEAAEPCLHSIQEDQDTIEAAAIRYSIPNFYAESQVRYAYQYDQFTYESYEEIRVQQRENAEIMWDTNRELTRAMQFANAGLSKQLQEARAQLLAVMDERIAAAATDRERAKVECENAYRQHLINAEELVSAEYAQAEHKRHEHYVMLCKLMETIRDTRQMAGLILKFEHLGDYLDSAERAELCAKQITDTENEKKQRLEQAQELEHQKYVRRNKGLCQHCGGTFKGIIGRKCSLCGIPKDYT